MADFNFIIIPELRACLESDYREMQFCLEARAWKAVHVLAGSILEAVLLDALHSEKACQGKNLDKLELSDLVRLAHETGVICDDSERLSTVVRGYRNLIHPGRLKRLERTPDENGAVIASRVVEVITGEVVKRKGQTYGPTAEQLFTRLNSGESVFPVIEHLVKDAKPQEQVRLVTKLLPNAIVSELSDSFEGVGNVKHLCKVYNWVMPCVQVDVYNEVAKEIAQIYREKPEDIVNIYEERLFRFRLCKWMEPSDVDLIKTHYLGRFRSEQSPALMRLIDGLGCYLDSAEVELCVRAICGCIGRHNISRYQCEQRIVEFFDSLKDDDKLTMIREWDEYYQLWMPSEEPVWGTFNALSEAMKKRLPSVVSAISGAPAADPLIPPAN